MVRKSEGKEKPTSVGTEFCKVAKPGNPQIYKNFNFAKTSACNAVLVDAMKNFGIKAWALARLLGLPWLNQIYQWLDGTQRPSQIYSMRLTKLYQLERQGLKLLTVHHIDWDGTGEIHLKEIVSVPGPGEVTPRRQISPEDEELRDKYMKYTPR